MEDIQALLKLFGERYIFCDDPQAIFDAQHHREDLVQCFVSILHYAQDKAEAESEK